MSLLLENSLDRLADLVALWNQCSCEPFTMDLRLMRQYLQHPGALVLAKGDPWKGVLWGRQGSLGATMDAVLVLPEARRRGVGRCLVEAFSRGLEGHAEGWRFGGGNHHFVPGLPQQMSHAQPFLLTMGLVADWHAHDLVWRLAQGGTTGWDEAVYRLVTAAEIRQLKELLTHFGKRWQEDTNARCQAFESGGAEEIMGAYQGGRLVGFCHIWSERSRSLGPSTFWLARESSGWAGIGPLGVHPDVRGCGLGAGVVEASMAYLRRGGAQRIGVDWTGLPKFYQRCGFEPWLSYRGFHLESARRPGHQGRRRLLDRGGPQHHG